MRQYSLQLMQQLSEQFAEPERLEVATLRANLS